MNNKFGDPVHPGEILNDELEYMKINVEELADKLHLSQDHINQILNGDCDITADTALRLGKFFGTGPRIWLNLQKSYELDLATKNIGHEINNIMPYEKIS